MNYRQQGRGMPFNINTTEEEVITFLQDSLQTNAGSLSIESAEQKAFGNEEYD